MRRLVFIFAVWSLSQARPELYREKEDFSYSRSSSDDGSKSGYYGAQRGNMGGNFERSHNMDGLAQHQMSGLVKQVEGELGDTSNTRTGSVFSSANSRGIYGSGHYDLSNLEGRSFTEGTHYGDSQSQSSLSQSRYTGHSAHSAQSTSHDSQYSDRRSESSRYGSDYQQRQQVGQSIQTDELQSSGLSNGQYDYGRGSGSSRHYQQVGHSGQSGYRDSSQYRSSDYGSGGRLQTQLIRGEPSKIIIRPGTRVTIPVGAQIQNADQIYSQRSEAQSAGNSDQQTDYSASGGPQYYQSSSSYRKEWEKQDSRPVAVPYIPKRSESYDDSQTSDRRFAASGTDTQSSRYGYSGYNANAQSSSSQYQNAYTSQQHGSGSDYSSDISTGSSGHAGNLVGEIDSRPKSYQSSYSYHKSWEKQGDPYVIIPSTKGGDDSVSQRLTSDQSRRYSQGCSIRCDESGHLRASRSAEYVPDDSQSFYTGQEDMGQQIQTGWSNVEDLGQSIQNEWDQMEDLGQQQQSKWEDLGQQPQSKWEDLGQQPQSKWEDLGQQPQSKWEELGQQPQNKWEDLGQQPQSKWDDLGQQPQSKWEDFGQQTQTDDELTNFQHQRQGEKDKLEDFGQQIQDKPDKVETPVQKHKIEDLSHTHTSTRQESGGFEQQTEEKLHLDDSGQSAESRKPNLEKLDSQSQDQWRDIQQSEQQTQNMWDQFEDKGQQTQDSWDKSQKNTPDQLVDFSQQTRQAVPSTLQSQTSEQQTQTSEQQTQTKWDQYQDIGQQTQYNWGELQNKTPEQSTDLKDYSQQTQDELPHISQDTYHAGEQVKPVWEQSQEHSFGPISSDGKVHHWGNVHGHELYTSDISHNTRNSTDQWQEVSHSSSGHSQSHSNGLENLWQMIDSIDEEPPRDEQNTKYMNVQNKTNNESPSEYGSGRGDISELEEISSTVTTTKPTTSKESSQLHVIKSPQEIVSLKENKSSVNTEQHKSDTTLSVLSLQDWLGHEKQQESITRTTQAKPIASTETRDIIQSQKPGTFDSKETLPEQAPQEIQETIEQGFGDYQKTENLEQQVQTTWGKWEHSQNFNQDTDDFGQQLQTSWQTSDAFQQPESQQQTQDFGQLRQHTDSIPDFYEQKINYQEKAPITSMHEDIKSHKLEDTQDVPRVVVTEKSTTEAVTENPGFWNNVGSKLSNAKDKVYSWFRRN